MGSLTKKKPPLSETGGVFFTIEIFRTSMAYRNNGYFIENKTKILFARQHRVFHQASSKSKLEMSVLC